MNLIVGKMLLQLLHLPFCIDDCGEGFHADMNHNRYLVNRILQY